MRKNLVFPFLMAVILIIPSCDSYKFEGMNGHEALLKANKMDFHDAYIFYVDTYSNTSPPMLDVANTFKRFGQEGTLYIAERALTTRDANEFEADMSALLILGYRCPKSQKDKFLAAAQRLDSKLGSVALICD